MSPDVAAVNNEVFDFNVDELALEVEMKKIQNEGYVTNDYVNNGLMNIGQYYALIIETIEDGVDYDDFPDRNGKTNGNIVTGSENEKNVDENNNDLI